MNTITGKDLWDGADEEGREYFLVSEEMTGRWRWGTHHDAVYKRECDNTYWLMQYQVQIEEGIDWDSVTISQVEPYEETVVVKRWRPV